MYNVVINDRVCFLIWSLGIIYTICATTCTIGYNCFVITQKNSPISGSISESNYTTPYLLEGMLILNPEPPEPPEPDLTDLNGALN
jgi:hypothetical protein